MFGTNAIRKQDIGDGNTLQVQEIFSTIQGEGPLSGVPATFIRLWGCNLRCNFCDTDFESKNTHMTIDEIMAKVEDRLVVITGGEPFRQNISALCRLLVSKKHQVQVETAGTLWLEDFPVSAMLVCSPKTEKVNPNILTRCHYWKYVITADETSDIDGLPVFSTQILGQPSEVQRPPRNAHVYVQPCDQYDEFLNNRNMLAAISSARKHGYTLCTQLHKIWNLP